MPVRRTILILISVIAMAIMALAVIGALPLVLPTDFAVQQLVTQPSVEAFAIAIFPRASWLDVSRLGSDGSDPFPKSNGDELRAVV